MHGSNTGCRKLWFRYGVVGLIIAHIEEVDTILHNIPLTTQIWRSCTSVTNVKLGQQGQSTAGSMMMLLCLNSDKIIYTSASNLFDQQIDSIKTFHALKFKF